jgi:diadenylate cyclase
MFAIPRVTITAAIDILAVAVIIYQVLQIVRGTRAAHILVGILTVFIAYQIALRTGLEALRTILASLAPYTAIAIIVLFQSEIRRTLARLGRKRLFGGYARPESTDEILLALSALSRDRTSSSSATSGCARSSRAACASTRRFRATCCFRSSCPGRRCTMAR